jgi:hypothetical protein
MVQGAGKRLICLGMASRPPGLMLEARTAQRRDLSKGLCSVGNNREKRIPCQEPDPEKSQSGLARLLRTNESEGGPSEYICADKDADYLRRDVDNPTLGIFRVPACVAALIEAAEAAIDPANQTTM